MEDSNALELALDAALLKLQECQKLNNFESCSACEKIYECEIRASYVDCVYTSMNKGAGGFFDFDGAEQ